MKAGIKVLFFKVMGHFKKYHFLPAGGGSRLLSF